jgi:hypothetical protein
MMNLLKPLDAMPLIEVTPHIAKSARKAATPAIVKGTVCQFGERMPNFVHANDPRRL